MDNQPRENNANEENQEDSSSNLKLNEISRKTEFKQNDTAQEIPVPAPANEENLPVQVSQFPAPQPRFIHRSDGTRFMPGSLIDDQAQIGENVYVGFDVKIGVAIIGDNVTLCDDVNILDGIQIPSNTFVLDDQTTADLVALLQTIESVIQLDKKTLDSEVESIVQNESE